MRFVYPGFGWYEKPPRRERQEMARRQQAVRDAFATHIEYLRQNAPAPLHQLQAMDLSDAFTRLIVWEQSAKRLRLLLRCGNLQIGYFDLSLHLEDVTLSRRDRDTLRLVARHGDDADLCRWEVDFADGADGTSQPWVLRLQWNSRLEMWRENEHGKQPAWRRQCAPWWRSGGATHMLAPEIAVRFNQLQFAVLPLPSSPPTLFTWRQWVPKGRRSRRLYLAERRETYAERRSIAGDPGRDRRSGTNRGRRFRVVP